MDRYMLCYAVKEKSARVETEYYNAFTDAVMKYTVLCSNCADVVLADTEEKRILRHYSWRHTANGLSIANY
ncbi:MAG: hypothetical protein IKI77_05990 [Oscillospiraceae bacterium]|nr:hypothetical protein [Oscillospiraceae bacterium]